MTQKEMVLRYITEHGRLHLIERINQKKGVMTY